MKKSVWIIIGIVVVVAIVAAWFVFRTEKSEKIEWKTAKVEKGDLQVTVRASGTLQAVTTVQVGTQVSGIIKKINVDFNSVVKEGQIIALLDTTLLAQAVDDARASLKRSEIQVNQSKRDYDRTKVLFEQKVMAQADYDLALSTWETAVTNATSALATLNRAKINLRYATIIAPISGVVVSRAVDVGQTVAASFSTPTMFTIANDLTKMQVQASIDEGDIGKIKVDQEVSFTVDAYPEQTFSGVVRQVRLQPVVSQNVVNYTVIIDVPNDDLKLLPGMTANITVLVEESKDILKVPATALRFSPPQKIIDEVMKNLPDSLKPRQRKGPSDTNSGMGNQRGDSGSNKGMITRPGQGTGKNIPSGKGDQMVRPKMGMIWIKDGEKIRPQRVRVGLTDGSYTEVKGRNLKEGDEVILGTNSLQSTQTSNSQTQQSPFGPPKPPSNRGGR
ncbi:MAG: efflux RND transporter periplasmic adaptor subunit [Bacteroidales bacterium]|nr:efflux RND transporter periplasmic adaptor subunit [Bacteroidales bacterium]MDD4602710.1 efflux RND transporter periplasmic adaptor subunit [Bacteroidales bacterium]